MIVCYLASLEPHAWVTASRRLSIFRATQSQATRFPAAKVCIISSPRSLTLPHPTGRTAYFASSRVACIAAGPIELYWILFTLSPGSDRSAYTSAARHSP